MWEKITRHIYTIYIHAHTHTHTSTLHGYTHYTKQMSNISVISHEMITQWVVDLRRRPAVSPNTESHESDNSFPLSAASVLTKQRNLTERASLGFSWTTCWEAVSAELLLGKFSMQMQLSKAAADCWNFCLKQWNWFIFRFMLSFQIQFLLHSS